MLARRLPTWLVETLTGALLGVGVFQIHLTDLVIRHRDAIATDRALAVGLAGIVVLHGIGGALAGLTLGRLWRWLGDRFAPWRGSVFNYAILLAVITSLGNGYLLAQLPAGLGPRWVEASPVATTGGDARPNVVLLVADSLRRDVLDERAQRQRLAPHIDQLMSEAIDYTQHQAVSSWTPPSMAGMLTGVFPGVLTAHGGRLPSEAQTLAEYMRGAGYETVGFSDNYLTHPRFGFAQGHDVYWQENNCVLFSDLWFADRVFPSIYQWLVRRLGMQYAGAGRVNGHIKRWMKSRDRARPFYMMVHYMDTHYPYYVYDHPENISRTADPRDFVPYWKLMLEARGRRVPPFADLSLPPAQRENLWRRYLGSVQVVDHYVGDILDLIREQGEWTNTLVIFTADHGEEFFEHSYLGHGRSLYQETTRVPLVVKWPGAPERGVLDQPVSMLQILPTVLEVVGLPAQGDLLPPLPRTAHPSVPSFAEFERGGMRIHSARLGPHKLLRSVRPSGRTIEEYYRLDLDPLEQTNLVGKEQTPPPELQARFDEFVAWLGAPAAAAAVPEQRRRELKALGYAQ